MKKSVKLVRQLLLDLNPYDPLEQEHIADALNWIDSSADIYRIHKPDTPPKHLVSYFLLYDLIQNKVLLVDHVKANLWLPAGGHVDQDEDPKVTVERECFEELGIHADFYKDKPIFLTSTITVGLTPGHCDVSLWYLLKGDANLSLKYDRNEFRQVTWFDIKQIPYSKSEPNLKRFMGKIIPLLKSAVIS